MLIILFRTALTVFLVSGIASAYLGALAFWHHRSAGDIPPGLATACAWVGTMTVAALIAVCGVVVWL